MAIPTAAVKVELLSLQGVAPANPGAGNTRYARARFTAGSAAPVHTGRSRPLPDVGGTFDLAAEAVPWTFEAWVEPGNDIRIDIELLEDHGDAAPPAAVSVSVTVADPWKPGVRTLPGVPALEVRVKTILVKPNDAAFIARSNSASGVSGTLKVPQGFVVEIETIDGLYQPAPGAAIPAPGARKVAGYTSGDNLGRIFTNRLPIGDWSSGTQYVDVVARVTAFGGLPLPAGAQVEWALVDMDDPSNEAPDFHREVGFYVDPNDYDAAGKPLGAHAGDNAAAYAPGNADEDLLFGVGAKGNARWAPLPGYPGPAPASRLQAKSPLKLDSGTVAHVGVRIHCPNVLGTNFILRAGLSGTPGPNFETRTGVMTMWSRIDVEVVRMAGAHSLIGALPQVPVFFRAACVQLDLQSERVVGGPNDKPEMAGNPDLLTGATSAWVDDAAVFTHRNQPGWYFLGGARLPGPLPSGGRPPALYSGSSYTLGTTGNEAWVEVPGNFPGADYVEFEWTDGSGTVLSAGFSVDSVNTAATAGKSRLILSGNDVTPGFTGHDADGSLGHAYRTQIKFYPRHTAIRGGALAAGGFGVPTAGANVKVSPVGAVFTTGISPSVPSRRPPLIGRYFAGRTVIFTLTPKFSTRTVPRQPLPNFDQQVLSTVVHEFLHAFGMPHKCGAWNWRTPRVSSCCMNYFSTWLINAAQQPLPGTVGKQGNDMCGRHLMEVRRVHLDRNKGLGW
jgi:hypothetical protein